MCEREDKILEVLSVKLLFKEEGTGIGSELERFVSETRQRDSHFALAPIEYTKGLNYLDTRH